MSIHAVTGYQLRCDHDGCGARIPSEASGLDSWDDPSHCFDEANESGWVDMGVDMGERWLCPDHWSVNDDDEIVETP